MTKKIMKRSLALGALMAFAITGSAMAASYAEGNGNAITVTSATGKDRVVGGLGKDKEDSEVYNRFINGDVTVNGGNWNMAIGGHYAGKDAVDCTANTDVGSTKVTIINGTVYQLVGGTAFSLHKNSTGSANNEGRTASVTIKAGSFGKPNAEDKSNVIERLVMGGDLAKTGSGGYNDDSTTVINTKLDSTDVKIEGGTFDAFVIGGSSAIRYYNNCTGGNEVTAEVGNAKTEITGGTFNEAIVAGGLASGHHTTSVVENAELYISGKDAEKELAVNGNIFAGGIAGNWWGHLDTEIVEVGTATITVDNAVVKDIYGSNASLNGTTGNWTYAPIASDTVDTSLKFINSTAETIDIQKGDIEFRVEGEEGKVKVSELVVGNGVDVKCTADGEANDAVGGDVDELKKKFDVTTLPEGTSFEIEEGEVVGKVAFVLDKDGKIASISKALNQANKNVSSIASMGLVSWRDQMDDMNKRLGELRDSNGEHGVWVRMVRGESEYQGAEYQANTYQVGYDEKLSTDPSWTVGVAFTYTDGDSNGNKVSGENKQKGLNIYGSKLNDDGSYIDLVAKYARIENDFETANKLREGEYDTNGYSISAEYGKRFAQASGLWVEPQVQLTYGYVDSVDYKFGKADVAQDDFTSLVGRVGFRVGKDIAKGNVYAKASYLYDFDGETEMTMSRGQASETYKQDLGGSWYEVGVGTNINLSEATHLYLDAEKSFGGDVDTDWKWNVGVRYNF